MTTAVQAVAAVMADVSSVAKRDLNAQQGFNFRGIDAVVNAVGPALRKHGVVVVPTVRPASTAPSRLGRSGPRWATPASTVTVHGGTAPAGDYIDSASG
jgi:hypothetical protein